MDFQKSAEVHFQVEVEAEAVEPVGEELAPNNPETPKVLKVLKVTNLKITKTKVLNFLRTIGQKN